MSGFSSSPALDRLALFCALVTLVCVLGAHSMDQMAQNGELPKMSWAKMKNLTWDRSGSDAIPCPISR